MTTSNILATLRSRGVTLAVENGKLQYRGSKDVLTPDSSMNCATTRRN